MARYNTTIRAGVMPRRPLRHWLMKEGIDYVEDKGFLESYFVIRNLTERQKETLRVWALSLKDNDDA